jgi:hypothetical protein
MARQHAAARNNPARVPLASAAGLFSISQSNHQYHCLKRFMMALGAATIGGRGGSCFSVSTSIIAAYLG